jgi:hypothetical protein
VFGGARFVPWDGLKIELRKSIPRNPYKSKGISPIREPTKK